MSGERSPGSGAGGGEAGPPAVSEREPGAKRSQPGQQPAQIQKHVPVCWSKTPFSVLQELNNRLTAEITRMRSCFSGEMALSPLTHGKDVYELEVGKPALTSCANLSVYIRKLSTCTQRWRRKRRFFSSPPLKQSR